MIINTLSIHTDGGARENPGPAASAFTVEENGKEIFSHGLFLGTATNNVAEYQGVIIALKWLDQSKEKHFGKKINFFLDSELIVNQLNGVFKIKDKKLQELAREARLLDAQTGFLISYSSIPREKNKRADLLVNQLLDEKFLK